MAESLVEQLVVALRNSVDQIYPERGEFRNVRVVGHTPKNNHYIYEIVMDFSCGSERIAAKVYRGNRIGLQSAKGLAQQEYANLRLAYGGFRKNLAGVPRPIGDFAEAGTVVMEKLGGVPLQSVIMKAALLPGYADHGTLEAAARKTGEWLHSFHQASAQLPSLFDPDALLKELEKLCLSCKGEGLDEHAIHTILSGSSVILSQTRTNLPCSAVLNDFTPLNVIVGEHGIGFSEYAAMHSRGSSFHDVAQFLAAVEALEKYPFCNRSITVQVQEQFLDSYGVDESEQAILRVLKMRALLSMFAQGRGVKESAIRKKVMWATVMKRFIQQAVQRSLAPAA